MKKNISVPAIIALLFLLGAAAGCQKDETPSCSEAFGHFYDQHCVFIVDGIEQTRGEAIDGCYEYNTLSSDCGCKSQFDDGLKCLDDVGMEQCNDCDSQLDRWSACMATCSP